MAASVVPDEAGTTLVNKTQPPAGGNVGIGIQTAARHGVRVVYIFWEDL